MRQLDRHCGGTFLKPFQYKILNLYVNDEFVGPSSLKSLAEHLNMPVEDLSGFNFTVCQKVVVLPIFKVVSTGGDESLLKTDETMPLKVGDKISWKAMVSTV